MSGRRRDQRFHEPEADRQQTTPTEPTEPAPSLADRKRKQCAEWRPSAHAVRITDSKGREWLVCDRRGDDVDFDAIVPLGSREATVRIFWRADHVRIKHFTWRDAELEPDARATSAAVLLRQLRYTRRIDEREGPIESASVNLQHLYDTRRGMGRR